MEATVNRNAGKPKCLNPNDDGSCNSNQCFCPCDCNSYDFVFKNAEIETPKESRTHEYQTNPTENNKCYCRCECCKINDRPSGARSTDDGTSR